MKRTALNLPERYQEVERHYFRYEVCTDRLLGGDYELHQLGNLKLSREVEKKRFDTGLRMRLEEESLTGLGEIILSSHLHVILCSPSNRSYLVRPELEEYWVRRIENSSPLEKMTLIHQLSVGDAGEFLELETLEIIESSLGEFLETGEDNGYDMTQIISWLLFSSGNADKKLRLSAARLFDQDDIDARSQYLLLSGAGHAAFDPDYPARLSAAFFPDQLRRAVKDAGVELEVLRLLLPNWQGSTNELISAARTLGRDEA